MSRQSNSDPKTASLLFLFIGAVLLFASISAFFSVNEFKDLEKRCTEQTTGVVDHVTEELRTRRRKKHTTTYYVYITKYVYSTDTEVMSNYSTISKSDRLEVGDSIEVHYDPAEPDVCYTPYDDPGGSTLVGVIVAGVLGIVFLIVGISIRRKLAAGGSGGNYDGVVDEMNGGSGDFTLLK